MLRNIYVTVYFSDVIKISEHSKSFISIKRSSTTLWSIMLSKIPQHYFHLQSVILTSKIQYSQRKFFQSLFCKKRRSQTRVEVYEKFRIKLYKASLPSSRIFHKLWLVFILTMNTLIELFSFCSTHNNRISIRCSAFIFILCCD